MRSIIPLVFLLLATVLGCSEAPNPDTIIERGIEAHGGDALNGVQIDFNFREYHYTLTSDGGRFEYVRERPDSAGFLRDVMNNEAFYREIDGRRVALPEERARAFYSSLNSVAYFMLLPFKLEDEAVQSRYLGRSDISGEPYHEIEVTFRPEGGGRDYQDRFVYWFHADRHTMDYLAYDYVTDETGTRFREAYNVRTIGGIRFQDYNNYTSSTIAKPGDPIEQMDSLFVRGDLDLLSKIEATDISVVPTDE